VKLVLNVIVSSPTKIQGGALKNLFTRTILRLPWRRLPWRRLSWRRRGFSQ